LRKADELGQSVAGNWLWWSTKRLSEQKLRAGDPVEALLISLHNYLGLSPAARQTIKADDLRSESRSIAYPLGALHGKLAEAQAAAVTDCDRLAAHPYDPLRVTRGVPFAQIDPAAAIATCSTAIEGERMQARFLLQRARAHAKAAADARKANDSARVGAHEIAQRDDLAAAMTHGYPLAFNNMALLYEQGEGVAKDTAKAAALIVEFTNRVIGCCAARVARHLVDVEAQHEKAVVHEVAAALLGWAAELGSVAAHEALASLTLDRRLAAPLAPGISGGGSHGRGKSSPVIVAGKPANNADPDSVSAAESVERRAGAEGNANQHATYRTQCRTRVVALASVRQAATLDCQYPRREPYAGKLQVRFCAGGAR
jgi:TPR repeat protein